MKKQTNTTVKITKGQVFPLTIKRLGINGEGVGYFKKQVVFVPGALPGEEVVVEATNIQQKFAEGRIKKIRKKSPHRVNPPCPIYEDCGGCQIQHLAYNQQLIEKRDLVIQALERHTKLNTEQLVIRPTIGMDDPWLYRNKSQFQLGEIKGNYIAGLFSMNSHRLIDIPNCIVQHPATNKAVRVVKEILSDLKVPVYNERKHSGIVRTIVARVAVGTGEVQVVLITAKKELPKKELIVSEIQMRLPEVKSIIQNVNGKKTSLIFGDESLQLGGEQSIQEVLGDISFELSSRAFFQLNPIQTVKLYDEVKKAAQLTGKEKVVDAYCGVGTIGLWIADRAGEIRGMDVIQEGIEDARNNARRLGVKNAHYEVGKAETVMPKWVKAGWKPDVVIIDPPRSGCDDALLDTILKTEAKKVVYVSCNPSTLAKDLNKLTKKYKIEYMQPVDMFPQTMHVECVAWMSRVV
ncbi:23S rRNA (uracil(1939)-C(5))-methyltransferase RlmD [Bacillus andreraoultii]|uniref:23S rRNA (uracil(1939)-C(5))-methyltransferase RlmD n=1 Tax=Bacillus andreraoultii TaxID=1499685 RepID=UPI00053B4D7C|nr:23S rRNA (uracil(1939)-C(5))-methyltransferase RlmD [Bacillus andreraoultii]